MVTPGPSPLPGGVFDQAPRVIATLDDGRDVELFSFYAHERSFAPEQFVGLTVDEGRRLKFAPANRLDMRPRSARSAPLDLTRADLAVATPFSVPLRCAPERRHASPPDGRRR